MKSMTTKEMAMYDISDICARPWRGANTAHSGDFRTVQGTTVSVAGIRVRELTPMKDTTAVATVAPITGVVYPRLEASPV
ncbi:hypothetical protein [Oryzobacter telluris]|uniref:hypothetical protein n=1 Tax=Oryzobacter telluris TaxID=3149179 RepID=UPI00370D2A03